MINVAELSQSFFPNMTVEDALLLFMLVFTRWVLMTITMPFLGSALLPSPLRLALATILSITSFFLLVDHVCFSSTNVPTIALLFIKEGLIGFILGFFASLIFYAYELCGELIDFSRAASMSRLLVPELRHQSSALGTLLFQLSLAIFLGFGFHRPIIEAAYSSFFVFPVDRLSVDFIESQTFFTSLSVIAVLFETAVTFALPVIVVCFLVDLAFGLMNRVAPQINAYFLSLPAKMLGGLIMTFLVLPFLLDDFADHYQELSQLFFQFLSPP